MTEWRRERLDGFGRAEEVEVASVGRDGNLSKAVTIWAVRHGDDLFVRSVKGRDSNWFRGVQEKHEGRIRAGRNQQNVTFVEAGRDHEDEIDREYRKKYRRYEGEILDSVLTPAARSTTLKLIPR
jgi:hypothetical protein